MRLTILVIDYYEQESHKLLVVEIQEKVNYYRQSIINYIWATVRGKYLNPQQLDF